MKPANPTIRAAHVARKPTDRELDERAARRKAAEDEATAEARIAAQRLMDICEAVRPHLRDEKTMAEVVAEIRTRGPQPPLDYAPRAPFHAAAPSAGPWFYLIGLTLAFCAGVAVGGLV